MLETYWMAKRDSLGTVYGGKSMKVQASSVVEACMMFFRELGEFPTEVEWLPKDGDGEVEMHVGRIHPGEWAKKLAVLEDESRNLQEVIENQRKHLRRKEQELGVAQQETKFYRHHYLKLGKYLESLMVNTQTVWESCDAGLQNALLRIENRPVAGGSDDFDDNVDLASEVGMSA